jgi:hypothetical protein
MATNNEFISDALKMLGVLQETESASAEQSSDGLRILNDMMANLLADDVDVGYAPQSDPTIDNGINTEDRQAIKYLLAVHMAPHYDRPVSATVGVFASDGMNKLLRNAAIRNPIESAQTLPRGDAQGVWWDIQTGQ